MTIQDFLKFTAYTGNEKLTVYSRSKRDTIIENIPMDYRADIVTVPVQDKEVRNQRIRPIIDKNGTYRGTKVEIFID